MRQIALTFFVTLIFLPFSEHVKKRYVPEVSCPSIPDWKHRSDEFCRNPELYHCLELQSGEGFIELCINSIDIPAGYYPLWSEAGNGKIFMDTCPSERFQPVGKSSNKFFQCEFKKAVCNEEGERTCEQGDSMTDRTCMCDYKAGYIASVYAFENSLNKTCYFPKQVHRGCEMDICDNGRELDPAYRCVPKCKEGYFRPEGEFHCVHHPSQTLSPKTTNDKSVISTVVPPVLTSPISKIGNTQSVQGDGETDPNKGLQTVLVVVVVIIIVLALIAGIGFLCSRSVHAIIKEHETHFRYGQPFKLHCAVNSVCMRGRLKCQWFKINDYNDAVSIRNDEDFEIRSMHNINPDGTVTISELTIKVANERAEGSYECHVKHLIWSHCAETFFRVAGGQPIPVPVSPQKPLTPAVADTWRHADSGTETEMATLLDPNKQKVTVKIYNGPVYKLKEARNLIIGDNARMISSNRDNRDSGNSTDEEQIIEKPKRKPRRKRKGQKPSSKGRDTSEDDSEKLSSGSEQNSTPEEIKKYLERLNCLAMRDHQLKVQDVPGDGSCLYHAVLTSLHNHHPNQFADYSVKSMRKNLIKFFESNPCMPDGTPFQEFLCRPRDADRGQIQPEDIYIENEVDGEEDQKALRWQRFLKKIQDGEWGGDLEIIGIAQYYKAEVCVLFLDYNCSNSSLSMHTFNKENSEGKKCYIGHVRVHNKGYHFVALVPIDGNAASDPLQVQNEVKDLNRQMEVIHYKTIDEAMQTLYPGSDQLSRLKLRLRPYLDPAMQEENVKLATIIEKLMDRAHIQIGEYKVLQEILTEIDQKKIADLFEDAEKQIQDIREQKN